MATTLATPEGLLSLSGTQLGTSNWGRRRAVYHADDCPSTRPLAVSLLPLLLQLLCANLQQLQHKCQDAKQNAKRAL